MEVGGVVVVMAAVANKNGARRSNDRDMELTNNNEDNCSIVFFAWD
jgi:hypothetical protein